MIIVEPYARLMATPNYFDVEAPFDLADGIRLLRRIEWCGRISHRSEDSQTANSYERFVRAIVLDHGDWSIAEHAGVSVDMLVDRGITHEIVRHRLFSFTQESTRFVNYEKKMPPSFINPAAPMADDSPYERSMRIWLDCVEHCERAYKDLVSLHWAPQIARSIFPNALASRIIVTGNLRNWRHFLLMRTTRESHPQMRQVTIPLLAEFKEKVPILFEDIEPMARQADNMRKGR